VKFFIFSSKKQAHFWAKLILSPYRVFSPKIQPPLYIGTKIDKKLTHFKKYPSLYTKKNENYAEVFACQSKENHINLRFS